MAKKSELIANNVRRLYRDKSDKTKLSEYVKELTDNDLELLVENNLISSGGPELLDGLLFSLTGTLEQRNKQFKLIQAVLKKLRLESSPATMVRTLLTSLLLEIPHLTIDHLIELTEECIESICKNSDAHTSWKDILPECLRLLSNHGGLVNHCDTTMTTSEFVTRCFRSLCQTKWPLSIITPLGAMFLEIQLPKEEHLEVVNKLCCDIEKMTPDSLPPLLHQLLRFCKDQHSPIIYFRLNDYFCSKLYNSLHSKDNVPQDSESPSIDFDSIEEETSNDTVEKGEATCLYHACRGGSALKKFLMILKGLSRRPSTLLSAPTIIQILLAAEHDKDTCIQIIRSSFYHHFFEELRRSNFSWCMDALPSGINVSSLLNVLVENSTKYCQITGEGLLALAMSLVTTGGLFPVVANLQHLGTLLLIKLVKRKPEAAQKALKLLRDKLGSESANIRHLADTLKSLCLHMPHTMMECTVILQGILEDNLMLPEGHNWYDHCQVIEAVSNVIRLDSRLRDTLVMVCRKGLFSRDSRISCISVCGYLSLIKTLRCSSESLSQDKSSECSVLSQISLNVHSFKAGRSSHINNGTVCMEVITLLRRCFNQSVEVREQLYFGLPNALHGKPELLEPILNILYDHITSHYYVSDVEELPPLMFDRCVNIRDDYITLQEPIGRLLFTIQTLLVCDQPAPGSDAPGGWSLSGAEKFHGLAGKLYVIMLSLANRMAKCSTVHFNPDDGVTLNDISVQAKAKCYMLQQALLCYEALMAFRINEWTPTKSDQPQKLLNLQKVYNQILDFVKMNSFKTKKETNKKDQKSQKSQKNKNNETMDDDDLPPKNKKRKKAPMKLSDMMKNRGVGFKPPLTVWDLYTFLRALDLLYGDSIKWATAEHLNQIRTKRELHRMIIRLGIGVCTNLKSKYLSQTNRKDIFKCAKLLYCGCLSRLEDFSEFDQETALLTVECFYDLLQLIINNRKEDLSEFLITAGNINKEAKLGDQISTIAEVMGVQLESALAGVPLTDDTSAHKIIPALLQLISELLQHLPAENGHCENWIEWLQKLASRNCETSKNLGSTIISLALTLTAKSANPWSFCETLAKNLAQVMETSDENEIVSEKNSTNTSDLGIIASCSPAAYVALCSHLIARFTAIETVIGRIRADFSYLQYRKPSQLATAQAALKNREKAMCSELHQAATITRQLSLLVCPPGACCDAILRVVSRLHVILATATTHFSTRDSRALHSAKFDKLVKVSGKGMSRAIDCLISHIEGVREGDAGNGTKAQTRALKDTKQIPRLVYNCELFYKKVHQLSAKLKVDLVSYLSKGNARDFRIKAADVKKALMSNEPEYDDEGSEAAIMDVDDNIEENNEDQPDADMQDDSNDDDEIQDSGNDED